MIEWVSFVLGMLNAVMIGILCVHLASLYKIHKDTKE